VAACIYSQQAQQSHWNKSKHHQQQQYCTPVQSYTDRIQIKRSPGIPDNIDNFNRLNFTSHRRQLYKQLLDVKSGVRQWKLLQQTSDLTPTKNDSTLQQDVTPGNLYKSKGTISNQTNVSVKTHITYTLCRIQLEIFLVQKIHFNWCSNSIGKVWKQENKAKYKTDITNP
jgi:hypothetical protein